MIVTYDCQNMFIIQATACAGVRSLLHNHVSLKILLLSHFQGKMRLTNNLPGFNRDIHAEKEH